jgi:tetraacyldisaccharide 4'-kinase
MADVTTWQRRLRPLLTLPGKVYALLMRLRRSAYERGWMRSQAPGLPTVSVGNIAWGGAGKTPMVDYLLTWAESVNLRACVLTRGYGAVPPEAHFTVRPESDPAAAGDEPLMLARNHPRSTVIADRKRARAAAWARETHKPDLFLLDDGFQHLAVKRHLDLVLIRPEDLGREWNQVIPAGPWREPNRALTRADAFLIKAREGEFKAFSKLVHQRLDRFGAPVFSFDLEPMGLVPAGRPGARAAQYSGPYFLVTSVADPERVRRTAEAFLGPAEGLRAYPDHHRFSKRDWLDVRELAADAGAGQIVCTAKDAVKLEKFRPQNLMVLEVQVVFGEALFTEESFDEWWRRRWAEISSK